jgi:hypothetical protein
VRKHIPAFIAFVAILTACSKNPASPSKSVVDKNGFVVYSSPHGSFSCAIPGQWKTSEGDFGGDGVTFYAPDAVISIQPMLNDPINKNPEEYLKHEPGVPDNSFFPSTFTWNGQTAFHQVFLEEVVGMKHPWNGKEESYNLKTVQLRNETTLLPVHRGFYIISYESNPKKKRTEDAVFKNIVKTFQLKSKKP